jgi:hypothetical protein
MRCLVSIPPILRGETFAGSPPSGLQHRLIRSWIDAGFQPISMNTAFELSANPEHQDGLRRAGVDVLVVPPSAGDYPSYLPNLRESLQLVSAHYPGEAIAIINADIHIRLSKPLRQQLDELEVDRFLLAHRSDVCDDSFFPLSIEQRRQNSLNSPFLPGIDFIAARPETFREACAFLSPHLTIGLPWWDLLLPMALFAVGASRSFVDSVHFLHVKHEERWDPRWLDEIGTLATRYLHRQIKGYKAPASAYVWATAYEKLVSPLQSLSVYKSRFMTRVEWMRKGRSCPTYLFDVLRMTEALVCEQGWELDRRWVSAWTPDPLAVRLQSDRRQGSRGEAG